MKTITLLSKFKVTSANQLKLHLQPTLLASTQASFFEICTNSLLPFIFFFVFFVFKIYSQSFLTFFLYWCLKVGPESIYCLVLIKTRLPRAMEKITTGGLHCQHWNLIKRKSFPSEKKKIKYEPGSWNFFNFIISLWNVKQMFLDNDFVPFAHNSCYTF